MVGTTLIKIEFRGKMLTWANYIYLICSPAQVTHVDASLPIEGGHIKKSPYIKRGFRKSTPTNLS